MKFKGFIGNEKTVERLGVLMNSGHFPHALIIEGEKGIGKKTLALEIAAALVCRGDEKPCYECSQCKKAFEKIQHPLMMKTLQKVGHRGNLPKHKKGHL